MTQPKYPVNIPDQKISLIWVPVLVTILLFILLGLLALYLNNQERTTRQNNLESDTSKLAGLIETELNTRISNLQRFSKFWENIDGLNPDQFTEDVQGYLDDMPGFQAIEWVDSNYVVRWVVPIIGNEKDKDLNLAVEEKGRIAMEAAKNHSAPSMTAPVDLAQGGKGFLVYFPMHSHGKFNGFIRAVFRIEPWLNYVLESQVNQDIQAGVSVSVSMDDMVVYQQPGWDDLAGGNLGATATINSFGHIIKISSRPNSIYLQKNMSYAPEWTIIIGLILSLMIAFLFYLFYKTALEVTSTRIAKAALEAEVQEHVKTSYDLKQTLSRLELATKAGGVGIWSWDLATNALSWNDRMFQLYDIPPEFTPVYETWRQRLHPDDLPSAEKQLQDTAKGLEVFKTEFRIVLSGGNVRYLAAAARLEKDQDGNPKNVIGINWDLTDLKYADENLRKSEEKVRLLLNSTAEAIYGIDINSRCTFANPACVRLLGYTSVEQLLGKVMHDLIHHSREDGTPLSMDDFGIDLFMRNGQGIHRDTEVFWRLDGSSFPVEYWSSPQVFNGEILGAVINFIDITERNNSEKILSSQKQRLSNILEGTNIGTWEWNVQTGETEFNERWANIIGYTLAEISPTSINTWVKFVHPDDLKMSNDLLDKHFRGELDYYECEARLRHVNGDWVWVQDRGRIWSWDSEGKPLMMSGTHQDVTERKVIEEYLRMSEAQNRALLSAIPDLIFHVEREGVIINFKESLNEMLEISEDQVIGNTINNILDKPIAEKAMLCIKNALENGQVQTMEFEVTMKDASITFEARFKSSGDDEVIVIVRDVSERARLEQMKSDFINRATHELRTPIATMLLMANLLEGDTSDILENEYWVVLKNELNRERMLVEDLLTAGRLESDRTQFHYRPLEILELLRRVIQSQEPAARENNVSLTLVSDDEEEDNYCLVRGDETALTQVFINLVGNAIKFSPDGGTVTIQFHKGEEGFEISVIDQGIGIPPEDMAMLFGRFFRGTNAIENEIQGTGIGLFIVRSILDKHSGTVQVKSELGKGSRFDVWLPAETL